MKPAKLGRAKDIETLRLEVDKLQRTVQAKAEALEKAEKEVDRLWHKLWPRLTT